MMKARILPAALAAVSLVGLSGCITNPNTGNQVLDRSVAGGLLGGTAGYLLGGLLGGGKTARIIAAGVGGSAGAVIGKQYNDQIKEIRENTSGSGIDVTELEQDEAYLVNLPDVTFATGQSTISPSFAASLDQVAATLVKYPNSLIDIFGHTDTVGSDADNMRLSRARAEAVKSYLTRRGVASSRMYTTGYGETQLRVATGDGVNEPLNRRVEIKVTLVSQDDVSAARN